VVLNKIDLPEAAARKDGGRSASCWRRSAGRAEGDDSSGAGAEDSEGQGLHVSAGGVEGRGEGLAEVGPDEEGELSEEAVADFQRWQALQGSGVAEQGASSETLGASPL